MQTIHNISKEELIKLIEECESLNKLAKQLNTNSKEIYRRRKKENILIIKPKNATNQLQQKENKECLKEEIKTQKKQLTKEDLAIRPDESFQDRLVRLYPERYKKAVEERSARIEKERFTPEIRQQKNIVINTSPEIEEVSHFVISDMQVGPNTNVSHLQYIAKEIIERKPNVLVFIGDFFDMTSMYGVDDLNFFDGFKYKMDVKAGNDALAIIMEPIIEEMKNTGWKCRFVATLGNHENRINNLANKAKAQRALGAFMSIADLEFEKYGIEVYPFLQPVIIDDIIYCHYFTQGSNGKCVTSARNLLKTKMMNCVMGHVQNFDMHREVKADGSPIWAVFTGASYIHDEQYLGPQGNNYARIVWSFNDVRDKTFHPEPIHITNLVKKWKRKECNAK